MTDKLRSPLRWVPSLYFAMGLPFVVLNMVSAVLYKDLGISDAQIAFWTSLIMWPWTIKFLWSPFLELYRTKKFWVVGSQLLSGVLFGVAALSLHLPLFFAVSVAVFAVVAFSGQQVKMSLEHRQRNILIRVRKLFYIVPREFSARRQQRN